MQSLEKSQGPPSSFRVLLIEDDPKLAEILSESLRLDQITLSSAGSGDAAWEVIPKMPPDALM